MVMHDDDDGSFFVFCCCSQVVCLSSLLLQSYSGNQAGVTPPCTFSFFLCGIVFLCFLPNILCLFVQFVVVQLF